MTYKINGKIVSKAEWDAHKLPVTPLQPGDRPNVLGAYAFEPFVSPIDGSVLSSNRDIREHEKKHNVVQVGNDLKNRGNHGNTRQQDIELQKGGNHD